MKFSEHKFDRLGGFFDVRSIIQLIDDGMKPNWGAGTQNPEENLKIILSHSLSHF